MTEETSKAWDDMEVIEYVEDKLIERYKSKMLINEVDFLVGVMAAMTAAEHGKNTKLLWSHAPPFWIMWARSGRSVTADILKQRGEEEMGKRAQAEYDKFSYRYRFLDDMVDFIKMARTIAGPGQIRDMADELLQEIWEEDDNG